MGREVAPDDSYAELPTAKPRRREVFGYCMYDFANSSYTTLISTVAYSVYFRQAVVGAGDDRADFLWSVAQVLPLAILILSSPVMGALADRSSRKKLFLLLTTIQTVGATALLFFVRPGDLLLGTLLYVVGTVGFEGGYVFYNAFLREVSTPKTIGRISGWSWGTGFLGGLTALVAVRPLLGRDVVDRVTGQLDLGAVFDYRLSFVIIAAFFALFSVPTFVFLRESGRREPLELARFARAGFERVVETVTQLRRHRETAKYVAAALFFYGGIDTVIKFSAIYANVTFGIQGSELVGLFVFTNIIAVPGTLLSGYLADWIGGKRALVLTLVLWCALLIFGSIVTTKAAFWFMASGIAIGMGSTQAIGRSFMSQISPRNRESEFFGFYLLCSKLGSILSLLVFGLISGATGNQRWAVISVLPFFVIGLGLLLTIDEDRARRAAESAA